MRMTKTKKFVLILTAVAVSSLGIAAAVFFGGRLYTHGFGDFSRVYRVETFDANAIESISVKVPAADVRIVRAAGGRITVELAGRTR
ncbi:MAG: hypothetical protein JXQ30_07540 [Spirochaetes bacterium]|nr:hypothetical protein [Spirochaetota bacterium]